jgi:hypothetical protein
VAQIADRKILADMQVKIAAACAQNKTVGNRRGPDDLGLDQPVDVLRTANATSAGHGAVPPTASRKLCWLCFPRPSTR